MHPKAEAEAEEKTLYGGTLEGIPWMVPLANVRVQSLLTWRDSFTVSQFGDRLCALGTHLGSEWPIRSLDFNPLGE